MTFLVFFCLQITFYSFTQISFHNVHALIICNLKTDDLFLVVILRKIHVTAWKVMTFLVFFCLQITFYSFPQISFHNVHALIICNLKTDDIFLVVLPIHTHTGCAIGRKRQQLPDNICYFRQLALFSLISTIVGHRLK